jgi:hypothetical protein
VTHEEAEIAIGMRQHAALDAAGCAMLDDHLASCASCLQFEQNALTLERHMQTRAMAELSHIQWTRVEDRMARLHKEHRTLVPRMACAGLTIVGVLAWVYGLDVALLGALLVGALCTMSAVMIRGRARDLARAEPSAGDLLSFYRGEVAAALRRTRAARWYLPACALLWLVTGIYLAVTGHPVKEVAYNTALAAFFAGWAVHTWRAAPRLRRELAELA